MPNSFGFHVPFRKAQGTAYFRVARGRGTVTPSFTIVRICVEKFDMARPEEYLSTICQLG
jgi:hypothetical protein